MKKEQLLEALGEIDDAYLREAEEMGVAETNAHTVPVKRSRLRWGLLAACLVLAAMIGVTATAFVAEAKEYGAAVAFFEENGLSLEGLSRAEVKAVYRDITEQRFTYEKTAEVIRRTVPGLEIPQTEPTPDEVAAVWNRNVAERTLPQTGYGYKFDFRYRPDEQAQIDVFEKSVVECYRDGTLLWTAEFPAFSVQKSVHTSYGTAVLGLDLASSGYWLARVDDSGTILWARRFDHEFRYENAAAVLDNGDGTWAVISQGDRSFLCLSQCGVDGNERSFRKTDVGMFIRNAARLGDGYIVQVLGADSRDTAVLLKLDREGNVLDRFVYEGEDCDYYLLDMAEYGGQVYLSAYACPKQTDEGGRHEIGNILDYVFHQKEWNISSEELTPLVRENYTAVLLVCDPVGGTPRTFYSVKGSLGGTLNVNGAGELEWDVDRITSTFFSPSTSSFTVGGTCSVFRYAFGPSGDLLRQTDTGETVPYRR